METRTVEQVESWSTRSFADGFAGLRELSDGEFSGAVRAGGAWLFMLNGRIIGVYEGTLDDFEDADGTAYAAPHPSLPLLFSMQEKGGDTRAKYYTNDTPLSEVDSTLSQGSFTGYVELSENVLSGDYYVAYYGGRSMSVAFVGASEQVVTGDEAFERAADEVGIYEVRDVEIEVTDVPEPETADEPDASAGGPSSGGDSGPSSRPESQSSGEGASTPSGTSGSAAGSPASEPGAGQSAAGQSAAGQSAAGQPSASEKTDAGGSTGGNAASTESGPGGASGPNEGAGRTTESQASSRQGSDQSQSATDAIRRPEAENGTTDAEKTADAGTSAPVESKSEQGGSTAATSAETPDTGATQTESADAGATASAEERDESEDEADAFSEEKEWREATTIPSLDPDRSEGPDAGTSKQQKTSSGTASTSKSSASSASTSNKSGRAPSSSASESATGSKSRASDGASATGQSGGRTANASGASSGSASSSSKSQPKSAGSASGSTQSASGGDSAGVSEEVKARIQELRSQLDQRKQQVQQLQERLSKIESERDEYERERDALRQEVQRLEARLENAESAGDASSGRQLTSAQAFDGTNLFVRYQSKGKATLEEAAEGTADHEDVNANLQLEHHTQFEADDVSVNGRPFEEFLTDSFEYRFVSWIIEELLYEIRETGHRSSLRDLYESIPKIDRVDLHGSVSAGGDEEDTRKESFDVIVRDRMGNPLLVADLNDSRDPTTGDMMGSLVDASSGVAEAHDELSGAFQVTESFFEPEALETAESATSGGFLSREKRESFVKLSRKRGYHLCLVESRSGGFHLNVPEL